MKLGKARIRQLSIVGLGLVVLAGFQNCSSGAFHALQTEYAQSSASSSSSVQTPAEVPATDAASAAPTVPAENQAVVPTPAPAVSPAPSPSPVAQPEPVPAPSPVAVTPIPPPAPPPAPIAEQPSGIPAPNAPSVTSADLIPVYYSWGLNTFGNSLMPQNTYASIPSFFTFASAGSNRVRLARTMSQGVQVNPPSNQEAEFLGYVSLVPTEIATVVMYKCDYDRSNPTQPAMSPYDMISIWVGRECPATYSWGQTTFTRKSSSIVGYAIPMNTTTLAIHPVEGSTPQAKLPIGYYRQQVGEDPFFSNGVDAICHYVGMTRFTGGAAAPARITAALLPTQMRDDGLCP